MATESPCFIDGVGDPANCYKTLGIVTNTPEPTGIPGLTACLDDDSDSEDCEPIPGPIQGPSIEAIATELPLSRVEELQNKGIVDPEGGHIDK